MSDWRDKEAINETVFREMNEWTEEGTDAVLGRATGSMPTCASAPTVVALSPSGSRAWYEAIRVEPLRFAVALNHENPEATGSSRRTSGSLRSTSSMAVPAGSLARQTPVVSGPFRPSSSSRVNPHPTLVAA